MDFHIIIPARYHSSRLPAKPLLDLVGMPMIAHVYNRALLAEAVSVTVATDHDEVAAAARAAGAEVVMTRADHPSGTDRLQEVVVALGLPDDAVIVNVQGDEPLLPPACVRQVAELLAARPEAAVATLAEPLRTEDYHDPNVVKVVTDHQGYALYFSRASIPVNRDHDEVPNIARRHVGLYAYRAALLHQFVRWPEAAIERVERLEQLRVLYNGARIAVADACEAVPASVDTEDDLARVRALMADVSGEG